MTTPQYVSVRETAQILGVSESGVMELIEKRKLQAYRIADKFLRLKRSDVLILRNAGDIRQTKAPIEYTKAEKIRDFFYYNDFYIFSMLMILSLLYIIFAT